MDELSVGEAVFLRAGAAQLTLTEAEDVDDDLEEGAEEEVGPQAAE